MDGLAVAVGVAGVLLVGSGIGKVARPAATATALGAVGLPAAPTTARVLGVGELGLGLAAMATGATPLVALVAALYLGFAGFVALVLVRRVDLTTCGCFGSTAAPPSWLHLVVDLAIAGLVAAAAIDGVPTLADVADGGYAMGVVLGVAAGYALLVTVPALLAPVPGVGVDPGNGPDRLIGVDRQGRMLAIATDRPMVLVFLTGTCLTCRPIWDSLSTIAGVAVVAVTKGTDAERVDRVDGLAPHGATVLLSTPTWSRYGVRTAPAAVLLDAEGNSHHAAPTAIASWADVERLVALRTHP